MRKTSIVFILLLCSGFLACDDDPAQSNQVREIRVAALVATTGGLADVGLGVKAALELAAEDIEQELGDEIKLSISFFDTQSNPQNAATLMSNLDNLGFEIVIGPLTSAEVSAVKPYADANGMIVISPSSVARQLAVAGDNVFRFLPDDDLQAEAMIRMMTEDGIEALITMNRDDVWGNDLANVVKENYENAGGTVVEQFSYPTGTTEFAGLLNTFGSVFTSAVNDYGAEKVGVYLLGFTEVAQVLALATQVNEFGDVRWYGVSAVSENQTLLNNATAAAFAARVGFPCPNFALDDANRGRWQPVQDRIKAELGHKPDVFAMAAYDIAWVVSHTLLEAGNDDVNAFKAALPTVAGQYSGVTGTVMLNAAGDRAGGNIHFWGIRDNGGTLAWQQVAAYNSTTKVLTRQ